MVDTQVPDPNPYRPPQADIEPDDRLQGFPRKMKCVDCGYFLQPPEGAATVECAGCGTVLALKALRYQRRSILAKVIGLILVIPTGFMLLNDLIFVIIRLITGGQLSYSFFVLLLIPVLLFKLGLSLLRGKIVRSSPGADISFSDRQR